MQRKKDRGRDQKKKNICNPFQRNLLSTCRAKEQSSRVCSSCPHVINQLCYVSLSGISQGAKLRDVMTLYLGQIHTFLLRHLELITPINTVFPVSRMSLVTLGLSAYIPLKWNYQFVSGHRWQVLKWPGSLTSSYAWDQASPTVVCHMPSRTETRASHRGHLGQTLQQSQKLRVQKVQDSTCRVPGGCVSFYDAPGVWLASSCP